MTARERHARLAALPDAGLRKLVGDAFKLAPSERALGVLRVLHCQGHDPMADDWLAVWFALHPQWSALPH